MTVRFVRKLGTYRQVHPSPQLRFPYEIRTDTSYFGTSLLHSSPIAREKRKIAYAFDWTRNTECKPTPNKTPPIRLIMEVDEASTLAPVGKESSMDPFVTASVRMTNDRAQLPWVEKYRPEK
jgi:hypothetical protein